MTNKVFVWILLTIGSIGVPINGQATIPYDGGEYNYYPAVCYPATYGTAAFTLLIFPPRGGEVSIDIPVSLGFSNTPPNGTSLYTVSKESVGTCINRIEFNPVRIIKATCQPSLRTAFSIAVSRKEDKFLISGQMKENQQLHCGIFEISSDGVISSVLSLPKCGSNEDPVNSWRHLSLSPTANRMVAIRRDTLELIDIADHTTQSIASGFVKASWSPDGRWIAGLKRQGGTVLFDASTLKVARKMKESEVEWSPDSRYLLRFKECLFPLAVNPVGTIEILDVNSGKSATVRSSKCAVITAAVGWVSSSILPKHEGR